MKGKPVSVHLVQDTARWVAMDLSDSAKRGDLLRRIGGEHRRVLVVTEGLLVYLPPDDAHALARDLAAIPSFQRWLTDLVNPAVLNMIMERTRGALTESARMRFASAEGSRAFEAEGWRAVEAHSLLKTADRLKRLSFLMSLAAKLPEKPHDAPGRRPWGGVCVLERAKRENQAPKKSLQRRNDSDEDL